MSKFINTNEKYEQKRQVDYLPTVSQPDLTEALNVGPPTSEARNGILFSSENYQSSNQQLNRSKFDKNIKHSYKGNYSQHTIRVATHYFKLFPGFPNFFQVFKSTHFWVNF